MTRAIGLALALVLSPLSRGERATDRPMYAARTQLGYEVYTWFVEDRRPLGDLAGAGTLVILPRGTAYVVLPLQGDELLERPVCAKIRLMSGAHMDKTVYVIAEDLMSRGK